MADKMNVNQNVFELPISVVADGTVNKTLQTAGTFVDKNIKVTVTTPDASFERKTLAEGHNGEITATASLTDASNLTSATETRFSVVANADAHVNDVTVGTKDAGFTAADDTITVAAADATQNSKTIYLKEGSLSGSAQVAVTTDGKVEIGEGQATAPTGKFYIKADASAEVKANGAGYIDAQTASATPAATKYYEIPTLVAKNAKAEGKSDDDYATIHSGALVEGSYLYLEEGYLEASKISLAELVPDGSTIGTDTESPLIYKTATAYNNDGKLITGTMDDATLSAITANNASATIGTVTSTYDADSGKFKVAGTQNITGSTSVEIATTGYAQASGEKKLSKTGDITGTATVDATLDVVALGATKGTDGKVTPELQKETSNAKSGDISTTAPTDKKYVAVSAAAIDAATTVTPKVNTAGYGTADNHTATGIEVVRGTAASGTYYVGIDNGAVAADGSIDGADIQVALTATLAKSDEGIDTSAISSTAPTTGNYITLGAASQDQTSKVSGTVSTTITEGYVVASQAPSKAVEKTITAKAASAAQYIKVFDGSFM